jgi:hypothetical protein
LELCLLLSTAPRFLCAFLTFCYLFYDFLHSSSLSFFKI